MVLFRLLYLGLLVGTALAVPALSSVGSTSRQTPVKASGAPVRSSSQGSPGSTLPRGVTLPSEVTSRTLENRQQAMTQIIEKHQLGEFHDKAQNNKASTIGRQHHVERRQNKDGSMPRPSARHQTKGMGTISQGSTGQV